MTEPDEALKWARAQAKARTASLNSLHRDISAEIDAGKYDDPLTEYAHAYRVGQAASAARIKELEEEVRLLNAHLTTAREAYQILLKEADQ